MTTGKSAAAGTAVGAVRDGGRGQLWQAALDRYTLPAGDVANGDRFSHARYCVASVSAPSTYRSAQDVALYPKSETAFGMRTFDPL